MEVFRGYGHDLKSFCNDDFGVCAIKTVADTATASDRLCFLSGWVISFFIF